MQSILMTFVGQFNTKAEMLMERLRSFADGKTAVGLASELNHATLDAIAQASESILAPMLSSLSTVLPDGEKRLHSAWTSTASIEKILNWEQRYLWRCKTQ